MVTVEGREVVSMACPSLPSFPRKTASWGVAPLGCSGDGVDNSKVDEKCCTWLEFQDTFSLEGLGVESQFSPL